MKCSAFFLSILCVPVFAAPTGFAERGRYGSGAAIIEPTLGGEYVDGEQQPDRRVRTVPILLQAPRRQAYAFFSVEEEQALLRYRDQQLAARVKADLVVARKRHVQATGKFEWPKVVVRADEICVPELASSDAADWRDHLVCHREGGL